MSRPTGDGFGKGWGSRRDLFVLGVHDEYTPAGERDDVFGGLPSEQRASYVP
jgi:hypothetical protein